MIIEAVRLAAPERFIHPFLSCRQACASLLALALESQNLSLDAQIFVKEMLCLLRSDNEISPVSKAELEMLSISVREQEILQLLSAGDSNRQMAAKLSISESTVKTHLTHIYEKLSVKSRGQAVNRAKRLRLVQ